MSEREFENFLALLGGLLRLSAKQRTEIAGELRDHLEERLAELTAAGAPRDEAVQRALAEFGDAAGMAAAFLSVSRNRRKRWIMKWTAASIGTLAVAALLAAALWPEGANVKLTPQAVAQVAAPEAPQPEAPKAKKEKAESEEANNAAAEAALSKYIAAEFTEVPLRDFAEFLSDKTGVEFFFDVKAMDGVGCSTDTPVSIRLKKVRVDMLLDLVLVKSMDLSYMLRDGIVVITTPEIADNTLEIRVYNCRDLLKLAHPVESGTAPGSGGSSPQPPGTGGSPAGARGNEGSGGGTTPGTTTPGTPGNGGAAAWSSAKYAPILAQFGGGALPAPGPAPAPGTPGMSGMVPGMGGMGMGGFGGMMRMKPRRPSDELIEVLTSAVEPTSWDDNGGAGSIDEYGGFLVVNQTSHVHRKLEKVLALLREAAWKDAVAGRDAATPRGKNKQ